MVAGHSWSPCRHMLEKQCDQMIEIKICPFFEKNSPKNCKSCQNIYIKAQFDSSKHCHQTTFENIKYLLLTVFQNRYKGEKIKSLLK
jgi:hypothetical protein